MMSTLSALAQKAHDFPTLESAKEVRSYLSEELSIFCIQRLRLWDIKRFGLSGPVTMRLWGGRFDHV